MPVINVASAWLFSYDRFWNGVTWCIIRSHHRRIKCVCLQHWSAILFIYLFFAIKKWLPHITNLKVQISRYCHRFNTDTCVLESDVAVFQHAKTNEGCPKSNATERSSRRCRQRKQFIEASLYWSLGNMLVSCMVAGFVSRENAKNSKRQRE